MHGFPIFALLYSFLFPNYECKSSKDLPLDSLNTISKLSAKEGSGTGMLVFFLLQDTDIVLDLKLKASMTVLLFL